jgi:hypothetical protein
VTVDTVDRPEVRLELSAVEFRVGENPRSDAEEFGQIHQGLFMSDGAVVVSDLAKYRLVHIHPDGMQVVTFGRQGKGPGEIEHPSHLLEREPGRVELFDFRLMRRSWLRAATNGLDLLDDEQFSFSINGLPGYPTAMCLNAGGYSIIQYDLIEQHTMHQIEWDGAVRHSFGRPFMNASNRINDAVVQGHLLCLQDQDAVVVAPGTTGELQAHALDGALKWRRLLPQFSPVHVEAKNGGVLFSYAPEPHGYSNYVSGLHRVAEFVGLAQIATQRLVEGTIVRTSLQSRFFDLRDGQEIGRQDDLPQVLAIRGDRLLLTGDDPEPWVEVRRFRVVPREH